MDLIAPAAGKSLSCGQLIRITGISPLRGSLRAVSGSTIIILAVIAYMRSCLMVCDGILAQPPLFQKGHRVPHKWLSPGLMSQCLLIQFSMFSRGFRKDPSTYIWSLEGHFAPLPEKKIFCCRQTATTSMFLGFVLVIRTNKSSIASV